MTEQQTPAEDGANGVGRRDFLTGLGYATGGIVVGMGLGVAIPAIGGGDGDASAAVAPQPPAPTAGTPVAVTAPPTAPGVPSQPGFQSAVDLPYLPQEIDLQTSRSLLVMLRKLPREERGSVLNVVSRLGSRPDRLLQSL